jgi:hypothetical protein
MTQERRSITVQGRKPKPEPPAAPSEPATTAAEPADTTPVPIAGLKLYQDLVLSHFSRYQKYAPGRGAGVNVKRALASAEENLAQIGRLDRGDDAPER